MKFRWMYAAATLPAAVIGNPAQACRMHAEWRPEDVRYADLVVIGRVKNYRIVRDEEFRRRMLSNPRLSLQDRARYEGPSSLLPDYAAFDVEIDNVLVGKAPQTISVTWDNSTFNEPDMMPPGSYLIALRDPKSPMPPLRGPSAYIGPSPNPGLFTLLQAPCSNAFIFETTSKEASAVRTSLGL